MLKSSDGIVTLVDLFCGLLPGYMQYTDVAKHLYAIQQFKVFSVCSCNRRPLQCGSPLLFVICFIYDILFPFKVNSSLM